MNVATTAPIRAPHDEGRSTQKLSAEELIRLAHESLAGAHVQVGATKVTRLCRTYARDVQPHGVPFSSWFVSQIAAHGSSREVLSAEFYKRISYRDKTGEEAAWNVDRARQRAVVA